MDVAATVLMKFMGIITNPMWPLGLGWPECKKSTWGSLISGQAMYDYTSLKCVLNYKGTGEWLYDDIPLQWRHNDHDDFSNHQPHGCLLNRLFRRRSKKTSKLRVTGLCVGNSPGPVNSPHKGPVTRKMFPFDDVIMQTAISVSHRTSHREVLRSFVRKFIV